MLLPRSGMAFSQHLPFFLHESLFGKKIKKMPIHDLANVSGQARGWSCGKVDWSCSSVQGRSFGLRSIAE